MDEVIKNICQALKEEAEAVISYTDKIMAATSTEGTADIMQVFEAIRLDEMEHIQNLCLELTRLVADSTGKISRSEEMEVLHGFKA